MASSMSSQSESQESSIWPHKHYPSFSEGHGYCGAPSSCQPRSRTSPLPCLCSPPVQHKKLRINKSSCHQVGWMNISANSEGQAGVGTKSRTFQKMPRALPSISHTARVSKIGKTSCDTAGWTRTLQCTKIVCVVTHPTHTHIFKKHFGDHKVRFQPVVESLSVKNYPMEPHDCPCHSSD